MVAGAADYESFLLLHNLDVNLLHVNFLVELGRKLSRPQELCIHATCHGGETLRRILAQVIREEDQSDDQ